MASARNRRLCPGVRRQNARPPPCDHASVPCGAPSARRSFRGRRGAAGSSELHPLVSRQGRATPCARGRTRARTTPLTWDIRGLSHVAHRCLKRVSALPSRHGPMAAEDFGSFCIRDDISPSRVSRTGGFPARMYGGSCDGASSIPASCARHVADVMPEALTLAYGCLGKNQP